jgi:hypothetical protein
LGSNPAVVVVEGVVVELDVEYVDDSLELNVDVVIVTVELGVA